MSVEAVKAAIRREREALLAKARVEVEAGWAALEARQAVDTAERNAMLEVHREREARLAQLRAARALAQAEAPAPAQEPPKAARPAGDAHAGSSSRAEHSRYNRLWAVAKKQGPAALAKFKAEWKAEHGGGA